ncbi:MAG TPA: ATP-binding cassette domain-containing protein [Solirubrobacteraceae bacterium]|nr:ATP-binding cassette domain-containing protein [Solirubrobacteraceae bacterium]
MERETGGPPQDAAETGTPGASPAAGPAAASAPARVEIRQVTKRYGSVHALRGVDLSLRTGEIVGLVGDNGAGKSTLVNIMSGALHPTSGEILIDGKVVSLKTPIDARRAGIETVYQDLALAPDLSIWQNMFLGRERTVSGPLGKLGWLDRGAMSRQSAEDLKQTKIRIPSAASRVGRLSGGQRQAVAVGRAVAWGSRVVLMDEPTAALGVEQQEKVGELIRTVAESGTPVLLISHNLPQVYKICTRVVVLFHGQIVADLKPAEVEIDEIVGWITGSALIAKEMAG